MVTQTQYMSFKEDCLRKQPIRKTIQLSDLKFHTMDAVEYAGILFGLNRTALKQLIGIIGFSLSGTESIKSNVGEEQSVSILNALKNVISSAKGLEIIITVTPDRVITGISKAGAKSHIISADGFFSTVERLVDKHGLELKNLSFNEGNGNVYVEALGKGGGEFQVNNLSDEVFHSGISLSNTAEGIKADPYLHRLVCTNGMVTRQFEESFTLRANDTKMWEEFYTHLETIEKGGWVPSKFNAQVEVARQTPASLRELESGLMLVQGCSNIPENELEIFFRGTKNTYNRIHSAGIDTLKLSTKQKANLRTGVSVWDVVNGITDFASHNYGYEKKTNSDRHLQMRAGDLLCTDFDSQNLVLNQPF